MDKVLTFFRKFWVFILASLAFIIGMIVARRKDPPFIDKPGKPPVDDVPPDILGDFKKDKEKSDDKIDKMDQDQLADDVNARTKSGQRSGG
jgi:hypothetical protein